MRNYVLKRSGQAVVVLWAAYTLAFFLLTTLPGDAISSRIQNPDQNLSAEQAQVLIDFYGIDRPLWEQYLFSLIGALRGDLGYSITHGRPVTELIGEVFLSTLALSGLALAFGLVLVALISVAANYLPWAPLREVVRSTPALFASIPTFVVGIFLIKLLAFELGWIPAADDGSLSALIAPAFTLGILITGPLAQVFIKSIEDTRRLGFVSVLKSRGADEGYIFTRSVARNSFLPVITLLGLTTGELIAGSVITEQVFARPGIGQLTVMSVSTQDLPVLQGVVLFATLAFVLVNLLVDVIYPFIDPRVANRSGRKRKTSPFTPRRASGPGARPPAEKLKVGAS